MTHAKVSDLGRYLSSRQRARDLRNQILRDAGPEPALRFDLDGVINVSESFADELFGVLVRDKGVDWFREHVQVENMTSGVRRSILQAIQSRLQREASGEAA